MTNPYNDNNAGNGGNAGDPGNAGNAGYGGDAGNAGYGGHAGNAGYGASSGYFGGSADGGTAGDGLPSYGATNAGGAGYDAGYGAGYGANEYTQFSPDPAYATGPVKKSVLALVALIFGVLSLVAIVTAFSIVPGVIGLILSVIALIINRKKPKEARRTWMSVTGLILSLIGIVASLFIFGSVFVLFGECVTQTSSSDMEACVEQRTNELMGQ